LLVASRADGGNLSIKPEILDLRTEAENVLRGIREAHPTEKAIVLRGDGVNAWADPLRVRQVMRNLLTNAIKYGGDRIIVGIREHEGRAQLMVADDGVGVPILESDLIFERYYRSPQSQTLPGSVGIGLAVSRQLADLMDGTLRYVHGESTPRFELSLPLARTVDARPDATSETSTSAT
jgi:signal transduction histidine kinase